MAKKRVLVVGGGGYIGSHTAHLLREKDYETLILDNFSTGHKAFTKSFETIEGCLSDVSYVSSVLKKIQPMAIFHFAASCLVGESEQNPLKYYQNNVIHSINLFKVAIEANCKNVIFSSTAAVYGTPEKTPITENFPTNPINTYGRTKLMIEHVLKDLADKSLIHYAALRYFNAAGASTQYAIGEWHDPETHLIPNIFNALTKKKPVQIFGTDYPTPDGTCVRDYIHVEDLAMAHYLALEYMQDKKENVVANLGSEQGYSVREVIEIAKKITQQTIQIQEMPPRPGDPPVLLADSKKAQQLLKWSRQHTLNSIISSAWQWHNRQH